MNRPYNQPQIPAPSIHDEIERALYLASHNGTGYHADVSDGLVSVFCEVADPSARLGVSLRLVCVAPEVTL